MALTITGGEMLPPNKSDQQIADFLDWLLDFAINGGGVFTSAKDNATDHLRATGHYEDAITSLIGWNTAYGAGTGFVTGLGGLATMPITIPTGLAASYGLGAHTIAGIANLRGYDTNCTQVRTAILLSLLGGYGKELLKDFGIQVGNKALQNVLKQVPTKILIEINKKVGFRLITKAGEKGIINLTKMVPVAGGIVGAAVDGTFVNTCGKCAKINFPSVH